MITELYDLLTMFGMSEEPARALAFFLYELYVLIVVLLTTLMLLSLFRRSVLGDRLAPWLMRTSKAFVYGAMALLGIVSPLGSCSVIPVFMALAALRVPTGALFVYLVVTPLVQKTSLILLVRDFGRPLTILYLALGVLAGVVIGRVLSRVPDETLFTSIVMRERRRVQTDAEVFNAAHEPVRRPSGSGAGLSSSPEFVSVVRDSFFEAMTILRKMVPYIILGVGIGALIHGVVPHAWMSKALGARNVVAPVYATLLGLPLYADDVAMIPIAKSLLDSGVALGTVFSFVMASVVVSIPSFILLGSVLKTKVIVKFALILTAIIMATGYLFNLLQPLLLR